MHCWAKRLGRLRSVLLPASPMLLPSLWFTRQEAKSHKRHSRLPQESGTAGSWDVTCGTPGNHLASAAMALDSMSICCDIALLPSGMKLCWFGDGRKQCLIELADHKIIGSDELAESSCQEAEL